MAATGLPRNRDFNCAEQEGVGFCQVTHRRGVRWTTADGYVRPAMKRPNFTLLSGARVLKVRTTGGLAHGIEVEHRGRHEVHHAEREIVLSAGAFNTPQILMLSGIGPADHLTELGIDVVVDNPNVGQHLMDHPLYVTNFETTAGGTLAEAERRSS